MKTLYRGAQTYVSVARRLSSLFYVAIAHLLIAFALWLACPFGENWLLTSIAMLVFLQGAATGVKASELLLSARPPAKAIQRDEPPKHHERRGLRPE